ncbi:unnamed protein product [Pieris macdunnoughi]|uniref:Uncharacterized protein n=1 Tax=Pieris macdunnoughi TaxID=345717 RepID=A0A821XCQ4_9NEOP|nr:unnamed protein product [Pieris macdunnoughi]
MFHYLFSNIYFKSLWTRTLLNMKFLLICLLAAYCYADDSSESLLSKIEDHQMTLRVWEEDNSRLLSTLIEEQKKYDNAKKNEVVLLQTVDYLVRTNMEILENVLMRLKEIQFTITEDKNPENDVMVNEKYSLISKFGTDSDTRTVDWINNIMKEKNGMN